MSTTVQEMIAGAKSRIRNLTSLEVQTRAQEQGVVLVDIREPAELDEHGRIAGAVHVPRGLLEFKADPTSPLHQPDLDPQRGTIVFCAAGSRSALAVETLQELGYADVAHLDGGIAAWKQAGLPVLGVE